MLANIWLRLNDHQAIDWPEQTIGVESEIGSTYLYIFPQSRKPMVATLSR
jgi:hypothetical protein